MPDLPCGRREARREARRDAIVEVATRAFLELGYAGTTMTAIAARLGGSKGTLWAYFPGKEPLFAAVLDRLIEGFRARLALILTTDDDLAVALEAFCREFLTRLTAPDAVALFRLVVAESSRFPEVGRMFFERGPSLTRKHLATFHAEAMARGHLRQDDADLAARNLVGLCVSGCHQRMLMGLNPAEGAALIARDAANAAEVFLRAYVP